MGAVFDVETDITDEDSRKPSVLLIEDDLNLRCELAYYLANSGFQVGQAETLAEARKKLTSELDLLVVDINLPDGNGLEICRDAKEHPRIGIVVCTARSERDLKIACLRDRADAYLVKPVDPEELAAILSSIYRRTHAEPSRPFRDFFGAFPEHPWRFDSKQGILLAPTGVAILLTKKEAITLYRLFLNLGRSVSRDELVRFADESVDAGSFHRLEMLISRLRKKVIDKAGVRFPIRSSYKYGYEFSGSLEWE